MAAIFEYFQQYVQSGGAYGVVSQFSDGQIQNTAPATAKEPAAISSYVAALAADPTASRAMMAIATNSQLREAVASYHSDKTGYAWPYDGWRTEVGPLVKNILASEPTGMRDLLTSINGQINTFERQAAITAAAAASMTSMTSSSATATMSGNASAIAGTATTNDGSGGLSEGAKIGIGVGVGVGVPILIAILVLIFIYCCRRGAGALRRGAGAGNTIPMAETGSAMAGGAYAGNASSSAAATGAGAGAGLAGAGAGAAAGSSAAGSGSGYGAGYNGVNRSLAGNAASGGSNLAPTSGTGAASGLGAGATSASGSGSAGLEAAGAGLAGGLGGYGASKLANGAGAGQNQAGTASAAGGQNNLDAAGGSSKLGVAGGAGSGQTGSAAVAGGQNNLNAAAGNSSLAASGNSGAGTGTLSSGAGSKGLEAAGAGLAGGLAGYGGSKLANDSGAGYNHTGTASSAGTQGYGSDGNASRTLDPASTNSGAGYGTSQATTGTAYGGSTANGNTTSGINGNSTGRDLAGAGLAGGLAGYGASKLASGSAASQNQDGNSSTTGGQSYTAGGNTSQGSKSAGTGAAGNGTSKTSTNAGYGQSTTNGLVGSGSGTGATAANGADSSTLRAADGTPLTELFAGAGAAALGAVGAAGLAGGAGVSNSFLISRIVIVSIEQDLNTVFLKTILSAQEYSWYTSGWYKIVTITNRRVIIIYSKQVETREVVLAEGQDVNASVLQSKLSTQEYGWYSRGWYQVITINAQQIVIVFHKQVEIDLTHISRVFLSTQKDLNGAYFQSVLSRQEYEWYLHGWYIVITVDSQHWITVYNGKVQAREITLPSGQEATPDYLHSVLSRWEYIWYLHGWFRIITSSSITKIHFINRLVRNAFGIFIYDAFGNNASVSNESSASQTANRSSLNEQGAIAGGSRVSRDAQDLNTSSSISRAANGLIMDRRRFDGETSPSGISRNVGRSYDAYPQNTSSSINRSAGGSTLDRRTLGSEVDQNTISRNLGQTYDAPSGQPTTSTSNTTNSSKLGQYGTAAGIGAGTAGLSKPTHSDADGSVTPVRPSENATKQDGIDAGTANRAIGDISHDSTASRSTATSGLPDKSKKVLGIDNNTDSVNLDAGSSITGQNARGDSTISSTGNRTTGSKALNAASSVDQNQTGTTSDSAASNAGKRSSGVTGTLAGIAGGFGLGSLLGGKSNKKSPESNDVPKIASKDLKDDGSKGPVGSSTQQTKSTGPESTALNTSQIGSSDPLDSSASRPTWEENGSGWTRRDQDAQDLQTGDRDVSIATGSKMTSAPRDIDGIEHTKRDLASQPLTDGSSSAPKDSILEGGVNDVARSGLAPSGDSNVIGDSSTQQKAGDLAPSGRIDATDRSLAHTGTTPGQQDVTKSTSTGQNASYGVPATATNTSGKTEPESIRTVGNTSGLDNSKSDLISGTTPNVTDASRSGLVYDTPAQEKIVQGTLQPSTASKKPIQGTQFSSSSRAPSGAVPVLENDNASARLDSAPVLAQETQSGIMSATPSQKITQQDTLQPGNPSSTIPSQSTSKIPDQSTLSSSSSNVPSSTVPLSKAYGTSAGLDNVQSSPAATGSSTPRGISQHEPLSSSKDGAGSAGAERIALASSVPAALTEASAIAGSLASQRPESRLPEATSGSTTAAKATTASERDTTLKTSDKVSSSPEIGGSTSRIPRAPGSGNAVSKFTENSKDISDTDSAPAPAPDRSESKKRLSGFGSTLSRFGFGSKKSKDTPKKSEQTENKPSSASKTTETKTIAQPAAVPTSTGLTGQTSNGSTTKEGSGAPVPASTEIQRMDGSTEPSNVARVNALARETLQGGNADVKDSKPVSTSTTGQASNLSPNTADTINVEQGSLKRDVAPGTSQVARPSVPESSTGVTTDKVDSDRLKSTTTRELEKTPESKNVTGVPSSTSTGFVTGQSQDSNTGLTTGSEAVPSRGNLQPAVQDSLSGGSNIGVPQSNSLSSEGKVLPSTTQSTTGISSSTQNFLASPSSQQTVHSGKETSRVLIDPVHQAPGQTAPAPATTSGAANEYYQTGNAQSIPSTTTSLAHAPASSSTRETSSRVVPGAIAGGVLGGVAGLVGREIHQAGDAPKAPETSSDTVYAPGTSSTREFPNQGSSSRTDGDIARDYTQTDDVRNVPLTSTDTAYVPITSSTRGTATSQDISQAKSSQPQVSEISRDSVAPIEPQGTASGSSGAQVPSSTFAVPAPHDTIRETSLPSTAGGEPRPVGSEKVPVGREQAQSTAGYTAPQTIDTQAPSSTLTSDSLPSTELPEVPRTGGSLTDLEGQKTATSSGNVPTIGQSAQAQNTTEQIMSSTAKGGEKPVSPVGTSNVSAPTGLDTVVSTAQITSPTQAPVSDSTRSLAQGKNATWSPRDVQEDAAFGFYGKTQGIVPHGSSTSTGESLTAAPALVEGSSRSITQDLPIGGTSRNVLEDAASGFYGKTQGVLPDSSIGGITSPKSPEQPTSTAITSGNISSSIQPTGDSSSVVDNATLPGAFPGTASSTLPSTEGESATKSLLDKPSTSDNVSATPINTSTNRESLANTVASLDTAGPWSPQSNTFSIPGDRSSASSEEESPESSTTLGTSNRLSKSVLGAVGGAVGALGLTGIAKALAPEGSHEAKNDSASASRDETQGTSIAQQNIVTQPKDITAAEKTATTSIIPSDDKVLVPEQTSVPHAGKVTSPQSSEDPSKTNKSLLVASDELAPQSQVPTVESQKSSVPEPHQKSTGIDETVTSQPTTVASTLVPGTSAPQTTSSKLISGSKDAPVEPVSKDTSIPASQEISRNTLTVDGAKPTAGDSISREIHAEQQPLTSDERTNLQDTTPKDSVSHATRDASTIVVPSTSQTDKAISSAVDTTPSANETSSTRPLTTTSSVLESSTLPSASSKDAPITSTEQKKSMVPQSTSTGTQPALNSTTGDLPTTSSGTVKATPAEFDVAPSATDAFKNAQPSTVEGSAPVKQATSSSTAQDVSSSKVDAPEPVVGNQTSTSVSRELPSESSANVVTGTRGAVEPQASTSSSILDTARNVVTGSSSTSSEQPGSTTGNVQDTVKEVSNQASAAIVGTAAAVVGSKVLSSSDSKETEEPTTSTNHTIVNESVDTTHPETENTTASVLETARETLGTASQQVADTVNGTAASARSAVESLRQNATTAPATESSSTSAIDRSIAPQEQSTTAGFYEKAQDTASQTSEQVSKALSQTATAARGTTQSAIDSASKASEQASKTLSQSATTAQDTARSAADSVSQTFTSSPTARDTTTPSTESTAITGSEKPAEQQTPGATTSVVEQARNVTGKVPEQARNVAGQASEQAYKTISQSAAATQSTAQSAADSARETFGTSPTSQGTTTSTTERSVATGSGKSAEPQTRSSTAGVIEQVQDVAGKTSEQVQTTAGQANEQVRTAAGQATKQVQDVAGQTYKQGKETIAKTSEQLQTVGGQTQEQVQSAAGQVYEQGQSAAAKTSESVQDATNKTSEQLSSTLSQPSTTSPAGDVPHQTSTPSSKAKAIDAPTADHSIDTDSKDTTRTVLPEQAQGTLNRASEQASTILAGTAAVVASAVETGKQYVPSSETIGIAPSSNDRGQPTGSKETTQTSLTEQARSVLNDVAENASNAFGEVPGQASNALAGASSAASSAVETGKQYVPSTETVTANSGATTQATITDQARDALNTASERASNALTGSSSAASTADEHGKQYTPSSQTIGLTASGSGRDTVGESQKTTQQGLAKQAQNALGQAAEQTSSVVAGTSSAVSSAAETGKQYIPSPETAGLAPSSTERDNVVGSQETTKGSATEQAQGVLGQASEQASNALTGASSVMSSAAKTGKQYVPSTESLGLTSSGTDRSIATGSNATERVQQGNTSSGLFGLIQGAVEQVTHILPGTATSSGEENTNQVPITETSSSATREQIPAAEATNNSRPSGSTFAPKLTIVERPETVSDSAGAARKKFSITHLESHGETIESGDLKDIFFDSPEAAQQHVDDLVSTHVNNASSSTEPQTMKLEHYESSGSGASGMTLWTMIKSGLGYGDSQTQQALASKAIQEQVNTEGNIVKLEHYESTAPDQRGMTTWNVIPAEASGPQASTTVPTAPKENIVVRGGEGSETAISQGVRSGQHQGFSLKGKETIASGIEKQTETGKEVSSTDQPVIFKNGQIIIPGHNESTSSSKDTNGTSEPKGSTTSSGPQEFSLTSRELVLPYHQEIDDTFMQSILSSQEYSWYLSGFYKIFTTGGQKRIVINNREVDTSSSTHEAGSDAVQQLASRVENTTKNTTSTGTSRNITSDSRGDLDFEQLRQTLPADEFEKLKMTAITSAGQPASTQQMTTSSSSSDRRTLNLTTPDGAHHELDITGKSEAEVEQLVASYSQRFTSTTVSASSSSDRRTLNLTLPDGKVEELDVTGKSDEEIEQLIASYTARYTGGSVTTSSSGSKEVSSSTSRRLLNLTLPSGEVKEFDVTGKSDKEIEELVASYDRRALNLTLPDGTVKELDITGKSEQEIEDLVASYNRQTLNLTLPSGEVKELDITGKSEKEVEDLVASYNRRMLNLTLPSGEIKELDVTGKSEEEIQQLIASYSEQTTTTTTTSASGSSSKRILNLTLPDGQVKELDVTGKTDSEIEELVASHTKHTTTSTTGFSSSSSSHRTLNLTLPSGETKELDVTGKSDEEIQQLIASYTTTSTTNVSYEQMVSQMREDTEDDFESAETREQQFFDTEEGQESTFTRTVVSSESRNLTDGSLPPKFSGTTTDDGERKYVSDIGDFEESSGGPSLFG